MNSTNFQSKNPEYRSGMRMILPHFCAGVWEEAKNIYEGYYCNVEYVTESDEPSTLVRRIINCYGGRIWVEDCVAGNYQKGVSIAIMMQKYFA